jgi:hypothetical protein
MDNFVQFIRKTEAGAADPEDVAAVVERALTAARPQERYLAGDDARMTVESSGAPSRLWSLLIDARSWPRWGTVDSLVLERSEGISPDGRDEVGAVRAFRTGRVVTSERLVELDPGRRFAYEDAENPFMKNLRAEILLSQKPAGGSVIRWHGSYEVPFGLHLALRRTMDRTMRRMAEGLARAADVSPG